MVARDRDREVADFVVAAFAEWAGDFAYALAQRHLLASSKQFDDETRFAEPVDALAFTSTVRAKQIRARMTGESGSQGWRSPGSRIEGHDVPSEPILVSDHLRAVVRPLGPREYEMR